MSLASKLAGKASTVAVVCNQWGDTGKGKFVDLLGEWAEVIARGTGGANAGHTVRVGEKKYIFHLVPSGILYDAKGTWNIIGGGTAFDPRAMVEELGILDREGLSYTHLLIAQNARLVLPQHILLDRVQESAAKQGKIGTTGRGIGPVYADYYARMGLCVNDLLNKDSFRKKLERNLREKLRLLRSYDPAVIREILHHPHLEQGRFWEAREFLNSEAIIEAYTAYGRRLEGMIRETDVFVREAHAKKQRILLEGAQGNLLSVDIGTYPFVTSSDCSLRGLAQGVGLRERDVDLCLGIVRGFYMTRVGEGPFPTELGGAQSAVWCATAGITKVTEAAQFPHASLDDQDSFSQGIGLRMAGDEYGATTGRPRRTGWLDLPLLRYCLAYSGPEVIFTKLDVLDTAKEICICTEYVYKGPEYRLGATLFQKGMKIRTAVADPEILAYCVPVYRCFPGWHTSISGVRDYAALPRALKDLTSFVEKEVGVRVRVLSVGPDRGQTIVL